jgi:adenine phosphoribosyltransferase
MFRDIMTLLQDPEGLRIAIAQLIEPFNDMKIDKVAGIEARGFIIGGLVARDLNAGFVAIRKKGKLPFETVGRDYELEYGTDRVEIHTDAIDKGEKILLIDDLLATGGTAMAGLELIEAVGGDVVGTAFIIDLPDLGGSKKIRDAGHTVHTLVEYEGD